MSSEQWYLTKEEKQKCIQALSPHLFELRIRADITMQDLSNYLGITRQSYSNFEHGKKTMSWHTYVALLWFYDNNLSTHEMLRNSRAFPEFILERLKNGHRTGFDRLGVTGEELSSIINELDDQALETLNAVLEKEYARCLAIRSPEDH